MNRCPSCGTTYPDDARFCTRDGTRLVGSAGVDAGDDGHDAPGTTPPRPTDATACRARRHRAPRPQANLVGKTLAGPTMRS